MWLPGCTATEGNEQQNPSQRKTELEFIGQEPFCGITSGFLKSNVERIVRTKRIEMGWRNLFKAIKKVDSGRTKSRKTFRNQKKRPKDLYDYDGIVTSHCPRRQQSKKRQMVHE